MIQQLYRHLNVGRLSSYNNQALIFIPCRGRGTVQPGTWLHNLDLTSAHMTDLIDFATPLSNNAAHQIIRNVNLLGLQLLRWVMRRWSTIGLRCARVPWHIRRASVGRSSRVAGRAVTRVAGRRHAFLRFNKYIADVVGCYVNCISNSCNAQDSLCVRKGMRQLPCDEILYYTSVEPGSIPSLAFSRAPLAS